MVDYATLKNKAIIYEEPGTTKTTVVELAVTEPGPGEVLIRGLYSGVCHTDYGFCMNVFNTPVPTQPGQIGGHEGIGEIIALGAGVTTPPIGTKVGVKYAADACLNCSNCLEGGETTCSQVKVSGFYTPGTFQQYLVSSANYVTVIPDGIDLAGAAPLMCGGVSVYAALKRAEVKNGDWVLVAGAGGGLGHLGIQYAKALGARVLAVDAGAKEPLCVSLGSEVFLDFSKFLEPGSLTAEVHKVTGGGARIVLMCSSSAQAYADSVGWLGFRGKLACLGVPEGENGLKPIGGASVLAMITNELTIFAVKAGSRQDMKECLDIAARGLVKTHYELKPMDSLTQIFTDMEGGKITGRTVIDLR